MTSVLTHLDQILSSDSVGGKAANLAKMIAADIPVPPFCVIPAEVFKLSLQKLRSDLESLHHSIDFHDLQSIETISMTIRQKIQLLKLQSDIAAQVEAWARIQNQQIGVKYFAVRSSGLNEDSSSDSFAGQFSSFLFVPVEEISQRVVECWASAFNSRALAYIHARGIGLERHQMSVVIQAMIDSKASGVLFTENPDGHLNEVVISAAYGLGEGVVADLVDTDLYRVDRQARKIESFLDTKKGAVRIDPLTQKDTRIVEVPKELQDVASLNELSVHRLVDIGLKIEKLYGHPQDVEWAQDNAGDIFIVQCRPITTLAGGRKYLIDNANVSESYPGISSPMTHEFVKRCYEILFRSASLRVGAPRDRVLAQPQVYEDLIASVQGRLYYNLSNWYTMFKTVPGTGKYIEVWEEMMGLEASPAKFFSFSQFGALKTFYLLLKNYLSLQSEMCAARERVSKLFDGFYAENRGLALSAKELSDKELEMEKVLGEGWDITLLNDGYTFIFAGLSKAILKKCGAADPGALFNDLLAGEATMESARAVHSTSQLLDALRSNPALVLALKKNGVDAVKNDVEFESLWKKHLMSFGDRCFEELKLETRSFRVAPEKLLELLIGYVDHQTDLKRLVQSDEKRRLEAEQKLAALFRGRAIFSSLFSFTLKRARQCMINRENSRLDRARMFGVIRSLALKMGEFLKVETGNSEFSQEDVFFSNFSDFRSYALNQITLADIVDRLMQRKILWQSFDSNDPENRLWMYANSQNKIYAQKRAIAQDLKDQNLLKGIGSSAGVAKGEALVLLSADVNSPSKDKILVAPMTDPGWVFLMVKAKGLVSERGSILSHTAIIGRELGIPTVVNVKDVTRIIESGETVELNGTQGTVRRLKS